MNDTLLQLSTLLPADIRHNPSLRNLSLRAHDIPSRTRLVMSGSVPKRMYFVASGWLSASTRLSDGGAPINMLRIRGDIAGLDCIHRDKAVHDITTLTPAELISVPLEEWRDAMSDDEALCAFVMSELCRDVCELSVMNAVIGRYKAPRRLAVLLHTLLERVRATYHDGIDTLTLPLTQEEIGLVLGLTNVSVNRAFRTLEQDGLVRTGRQSVTIVDEKRLVETMGIGALSPLIMPVLARSA